MTHVQPKSDIETARRHELSSQQYNTAVAQRLHSLFTATQQTVVRERPIPSRVCCRPFELLSRLCLCMHQEARSAISNTLQQSLHAKASFPPTASLNAHLHRFVCNAHVHASLSVGSGGVRRADESFETVSVDRIYIYMAMGRLRPRDGLISMKDLQVCFVCKRMEASRRLCMPWRTTSLAHTRWFCPTVTLLRLHPDAHRTMSFVEW